VSRYEDNDLEAMDRVEDLLDAYCEARLAPRGAILARIRSNVMAEAVASAGLVAANRPRLVEPAPASARWSFRPIFARAAFTVGFAAALTMGTAAAVVAAPPGSPFYNARVYLETAFLPMDSDSRFDRHEKLLDERLAEAELAAQRGDTVSLAAALTAYQAEVEAATAEAGSDLDRLARLEAVLAKHTAVLTALAATLPEQTSIEHAIQESSKAITKLQDKAHPAHPSHQPAGGPGGQSGGQNEERGEQ
jgi:uncharacterized protein DUF5667